MYKVDTSKVVATAISPPVGAAMILSDTHALAPRNEDERKDSALVLGVVVIGLAVAVAFAWDAWRVSRSKATAVGAAVTPPTYLVVRKILK